MPDRIVIVAPNWLGDAVMALPALQSVRAAFPVAHLAVAGRRAVAPLFAMVPGVDAVVTLEPRGGLATPGRWRRDAERLAADRFDLAVLLPNAFLSAWIAWRAGIPERWGYAADWRGPLLTKRLTRPPGDVHQADYYLALTTSAGLAPAPRVAHLVVPDEARASAARLVSPRLAARGYVAMAPGAAYGGAKQWPPERFAELAAGLWREQGIASVLVGAGADAAAGADLRRALTRVDHGPAAAHALIDLIGATDLATLAAVLQAARAVVANDSGAMHLAGAVGVPVIAIFGPTKEWQTSPLPASAEGPPARLAIHQVWCRPCMLRECPLGHMCMRGVSAAQVAALLP